MRRVIRMVCFLACTFVSFATAFAQDGQPPNIVLILSDDQAWTDYGFMGHPQIQTPNLDALANRSVVFRRGYVPTALCRPSLASIITGRYAHEHGITGNDPSPKKWKTNTPEYRQQQQKLIDQIHRHPTLPEILASNGYRSFQSGKWWEGSFSNGGFTEGMTRGFPEPGGRHGDAGLTIGRKGMEPIFEFMQQSVADQKPFFCWYAPFLPHAPHDPPQEILDKYLRDDLPEAVARYYAMCEWFDETCGQLIAKIDDLGITDNTIIVYVTDNGWIQSETPNRYAPRSKQSPYDAGVRTPIMYCWPGHWPPALRDDLATSLDIFPTVVAATGDKPIDNLPGLDLSETLTDGSTLERDMIFGEGFAHDIADIDNPETSLLYRWVIRDDWKLIVSYDGEIGRYASSHPRDIPGVQLFNLRDDPQEKVNVANSNTELTSQLLDQLTDWYLVAGVAMLPSKNEK
ncbi:MAG: sulfatase [Pirellulaceae bacterium]